MPTASGGVDTPDSPKLDIKVCSGGDIHNMNILEEWGKGCPKIPQKAEELTFTR
jgi:hypothetical protein